jgi:hypothetical protein
MYFGTGVVGIGVTVRQPSLSTRAGTLAGRTTPAPRIALETAVIQVGIG